MRVVGNNVHHNGQLGIGGPGDGVLIEDNEIASNNTLNFSSGFEAGGTKFVKTRDLIVRGNHVHDNLGPGLWTDGDNIDTLIEDNVVSGNRNMGIFHEISYAAVIRNNTVTGNGWYNHGWLYDAGILIAHSPDVEVYGNHVEGNFNGIAGIQQDRGIGAYGPRELRNLYVHDNVIIQHDGYAAGVAKDVDIPGGWEARNILFDFNAYTLSGAARFTYYGDADEAGWQSYGQDIHGTFIR